MNRVRCPFPIFRRSSPTLSPNAATLRSLQSSPRCSSQLPPDATTVNESGTIYFPTLSPQLRNRFRYDPVNHKLKFRGEFVQPVAGEYYLLLNVITDREKAILLSLSNDSAFQTAGGLNSG